MIDSALRASLSAFDDEALATLANAGLVRRAHRDLEEGKVQLVSADAGKASVDADGQLVVMDGRGPRASSCACKSVAVCRHRIAALLFLKALPEGGSAPEPAAHMPADPAEIITELDPECLQKWAGKANWRAALELVGAATQVEASANAVSVVFAELDGPVRILRGQGFDGIVSKASKARLKAYHAAAVLAARAHFGAAPPVVESEEETASAGSVEVDPVFLGRVSTSLFEVAALGLNLAPLPLEESLFEYSVSSRADSLPRLSALLRAIAAQVRLRRQRALEFDPDRLLELAATAHMLVKALSADDEERRSTLAGKLRRDFAPAEPLSLIGCGGERWRTTTGARGVTAWFIEPDSGKWLSTTLARGAGQDPGYMPAEAWRNQSMWQAAPLAVLAHARIELAGTRRSSDDRLSAPSSAKASIIENSVRANPNWPGILRNWQELRQNWLDQTGLGLDTSELPVACLIAPTAISMPWFDDLAQQLVWPVRDEYGCWLALTLDHEEPVSTAIEALEATVKTGWSGMILVRMIRSGDTLEVRPITLFGRDDPVDLSLWQRPWRVAGNKSPSVRDWLARLRGDKNRRFVKMPQGNTPRALADAWRHLIDRAEVGPALAKMLDADLDAHAARLESHGLPNLAARLRQSQANDGLLTAAYALLLARQQRCSAPLLQ